MTTSVSYSLAKYALSCAELSPVPHRLMMGMHIQHHVFFTTSMDAAQSSVSALITLSWGKSHQHPLDRSLGESQIQSWCCEEKKNFFPTPGTEPQFLGSLSHTLDTGLFHDLLFPDTLNLQCDVTLSTQLIRQTKDIPQLTSEVALSDMQVAEMK